MQEEVLLRFLRRRGDHALEVIRPPFGTTADWPVLPGRDTNPLRRDPRLFVSKLHDMRMPPYMRDANFFPLSIGRRQYQLLQGLIELLRRQPKIPIGDPPSPEIPAAEVTQ